ncbi:hypothetical protein MMRN_46170 [Mycobacterium marinum]|nr:hypothetical protein MMRN_46170 [Mycobacterium marinum]
MTSHSPAVAGRATWPPAPPHRQPRLRGRLRWRRRRRRRLRYHRYRRLRQLADGGPTLATLTAVTTNTAGVTKV